MAFDIDLIPSGLRDIAAEAEEWGTVSQDEQDLRLRRLLRKDPDGAGELRNRFERHREGIRNWGQELFGDKTHKSQYSDEDWAHPYRAFLSTLTLVESIPWGGNQDDPDFLAAMERSRTEVAAIRRSETRYQAMEAFSKKDYAAAAELFRSIAEHLTAAEQIKLRFCDKMAGRQVAGA